MFIFGMVVGFIATILLEFVAMCWVMLGDK